MRGDVIGIDILQRVADARLDRITVEICTLGTGVRSGEFGVPVT